MQLAMGALLPGQRIRSSPITLPPNTGMSLGALRFSKPITLLPGDVRLSEFRRPRERASGVVTVSASASSHTNSDADRLVRRIRSVAGALVLTAAAAAAAAALSAGKLAASPARAEALSSPPMTEGTSKEGDGDHAPSALSQFLESNAEAVETLRTLLYEKLDNGEFPEALRILDQLIAARPSETEWRFLAVRVYSELGETGEARRLLEEILAADPLSFEALFENVVLMDRSGEGEAAMARLESALETAREGKKEKEAREVRLIMAQLQYLQKKVEEALSSYEELAREDPRDYRPYFCQGVIYSLLDRNEEAREKFAKYKMLSPRKFDVEGFLQTPLSRVKLFGTGDAGA